MLAGLNSTGAIERDDRARQLAYTLRIEMADWMRIAYMPIKGAKRSCRRSFFGHIIGADRLNYCNPRVCCSCLKEQSMAWGVWDLGMVSACPIHRCLLIDRCPGCGHRLNRSRPAIHECKCGFDLRMARSEHADSILVTVNAAIYRAAGFPYGTSHVDLISAKFEPTFLSLQLDSCLSLVCFAGSTQEPPNKQSTNHRRVAADIVISRRLGTAAGELLRDWPHRFHAILRDRVPVHVENPIAQTLRGVFGLFYGQMSRSFSRNEFGFIHKAFEDFVSKNWTGIERGKFFSKVTRENSQWVAAKQVAILIRAGSGRVADLVRTSQLKGVFSRPGRPGGQCWITRESLNYWLQKRDLEIASYVSNVEASKVLGLEHTAVLEIAKAGLIRYQEGSKYGFPHDTYFHRDDVMKIKHAFERYALLQKPIERQPQEKLISLRHGLPNQLGWPQVLPDAIRAVVDGTLVPVAYTRRWPGIQGFLFRSSQLSRLRPKVRGNALADEFVNCKQAAALLVTTTEVIRKLGERGTLRLSSVGRQGSQRLVATKDIRRFAKEYVAVSVLAHRFDTSCPWVHRYLESIGVEVLEIPLYHQTKLFVRRPLVSRIRIPLSTRAQVFARRQRKKLGVSK